MRSSLVLLPLILSACGDKAPPANAGSAPTAAASSSIAGAPGDANSQAFAGRLVALNLQDFHPSDASGATITYSTLSFKPDGTWAANGSVSFDDENISCEESGPWKMDPADSATSATVTWIAEKTNCPGRDAGVQLRAQMDLSDSANPKLSFR